MILVVNTGIYTIQFLLPGVLIVVSCVQDENELLLKNMTKNTCIHSGIYALLIIFIYMLEI